MTKAQFYEMRSSAWLILTTILLVLNTIEFSILGFIIELFCGIESIIWSRKSMKEFEKEIKND